MGALEDALRDCMAGVRRLIAGPDLPTQADYDASAYSKGLAAGRAGREAWENTIDPRLYGAGEHAAWHYGWCVGRRECGYDAG